MHYFSCAHINKGRAAGTESADCVTEWPLGQAGFLVPPLLTLACERLKLFQIFPLNIYPARKTLRGKIPGGESRVQGECELLLMSTVRLGTRLEMKIPSKERDYFFAFNFHFTFGGKNHLISE